MSQVTTEQPRRGRGRPRKTTQIQVEVPRSRSRTVTVTKLPLGAGRSIREMESQIKSLTEHRNQLQEQLNRHQVDDDALALLVWRYERFFTKLQRTTFGKLQVVRATREAQLKAGWRY